MSPLGKRAIFGPTETGLHASFYEAVSTHFCGNFHIACGKFPCEELNLSTTPITRAARTLRERFIEGSSDDHFERVLCPTDLTSEPDEALRYGVAEVRRSRIRRLKLLERRITP